MLFSHITGEVNSKIIKKKQNKQKHKQALRGNVAHNSKRLLKINHRLLTKPKITYYMVFIIL